MPPISPTQPLSSRLDSQLRRASNRCRCGVSSYEIGRCADAEGCAGVGEIREDRRDARPSESRERWGGRRGGAGGGAARAPGGRRVAPPPPETPGNPPPPPPRDP